jgi:hypothetical protein
MFDSAYRVVQQPDRLVVTVPPSSLFASWVGLAIFLILPISFYFVLRSVKNSEQRLSAQYPSRDSSDFGRRYHIARTSFVMISIGAPLLFLTVGYSSGSIVLDRTANQASVTSKMILFLPSTTHSVDLNSVTSATLDEKPNSRRIRLEVSRGRDLAYPMWSDRAGQEEAVNAINRFLVTH